VVTLRDGQQPWHAPCPALGHRPLRLRNQGNPVSRPGRHRGWTNHTRLAALTGKPPTWFRPATAHYDDVAVAIVDELGERPLGFSVDADNGAKASAAQVRSKITRAAPGSVVLAHMNHPQSGTAAGVSDAITALRAAGREFASLAGQVVN